MLNDRTLDVRWLRDRPVEPAVRVKAEGALPSIELGRGPAWLCRRLGQALGPARARTLTLSGSTATAELADLVVQGLERVTEPVWRIDTAELGNVEALASASRRGNYAHIVAIGGSKVCDVAKLLALRLTVPLVIVPTILSTDGLMSPFSSLTRNGIPISLPTVAPATVLVDEAIIASAPPLFIRCAAFDIVSNISASADWSDDPSEPAIADRNIATGLACSAVAEILHCDERLEHGGAFIRSVVRGQILSGLAMSVAGSSRPCSGAEHLICHALTAAGLAKAMPHGWIVAAATRFCLFLRGYRDPAVEAFYQRFAAPRLLPINVAPDPALLGEVFGIAKTLRPDRRTLLDLFETEKLVSAYDEFVACD